MMSKEEYAALAARVDDKFKETLEAMKGWPRQRATAQIGEYQYAWDRNPKGPGWCLWFFHRGEWVTMEHLTMDAKVTFLEDPTFLLKEIEKAKAALIGRMTKLVNP